MKPILVSFAMFCVVGFCFSIRSLPGSPLSAHEASLVWGGTVQVSGEEGLIDHTADTLASKFTWCTAASYTGCGGGTCSTGEINNVGGMGNRLLGTAGACSEKMCNMVSITCGADRRPEMCE